MTNQSEQDDAFKQAAKLASASAVDGYASALGLKKNQRELEQKIHALFGEEQSNSEGYFSLYDGKWVDMTSEVVEVARYITANYTAKDVTSEKDYVTSTSDESKKLCNQSELDEAIQEFAAYARHEGDFDELDLKEAVCDHTADVLGLVLRAITPDMTRGEIIALINNKRKELL